MPRARERVVVEAEHLTITLNNGGAEVLEAAAEDDVEGARVLALDCEALRIRLWVYLSEAKNRQEPRAIRRRRISGRSQGKPRTVGVVITPSRRSRRV